ncbi:MAG: GTPase Era [Acidimicrobiia bacterium]|nr:GTPase Era [Acidimicrobiia bacterium]
MTTMTSRSGFVSLVGRPNVGKSTLLNAMVGEKVTIVSDKPQTTRSQVRGVVHRDEGQLVFVDTPGIHKPITPLGEELNASATGSMNDVDVVCFVVDATKAFGAGDQFVADRIPHNAVAVVNKIDRAKPAEVLAHLSKLAKLELEAYYAVSARTGDGVEDLVKHLFGRMSEGPAFYPEEMVTDLADAVWVAELVREQLFQTLREEMPYSIATRVTEWDGNRIRCEISVERESQKGMVIGKGGLILKQVGTAVRRQLKEGIHLELFVRVDKDWQHHPETFARFGYRSD